jgi:hypothetical protein
MGEDAVLVLVGGLIGFLSSMATLLIGYVLQRKIQARQWEREDRLRAIEWEREDEVRRIEWRREELPPAFKSMATSTQLPRRPIKRQKFYEEAPKDPSTE